MTIEQLERDQWHGFFEALTRTIEGRQAEVEVASADFGDQRLAEHARLLGISYDMRGDMLEIALDGLDHRIAHPSAVYVDRDAGLVHGIEAMGSDGTRTGLHLRAPLMLPEPQTSG